MIFAYARISTEAQKFDLQLDAFKKENIDPKNIYIDISSGAKEKRKGLDELLTRLKKGDVLFVWKIDRIARSTIHLAQLMEEFNTKGINFKSIQEPFLDTSSSQGKFIFTMFSAISQLERDIIIERTNAGLESAKLRGRVGGRPGGLTKKAEVKAKLAAYMYQQKGNSVTDICKEIGVSRATFYKYLEFEGVAIGKKAF